MPETRDALPQSRTLPLTAADFAEALSRPAVGVGHRLGREPGVEMVGAIADPARGHEDGAQSGSAQRREAGRRYAPGAGQLGRAPDPAGQPAEEVVHASPGWRSADHPIATHFAEKHSALGGRRLS